MPQIWPRSNILGRIGIALGGSIVVSSNNNMHGQLLYLDTELQVAGLGGGGGGGFGRSYQRQLKQESHGQCLS